MKEDLDEIALPMELAVQAMHLVSLGLRMDDGFHASVANRQHEVVRVVPSVADQSLSMGMCEQVLGCDHLVSLTGCQRDVKRACFRIDNGVELGRKTSCT
jgi:hypothetical protein